MHLLHKNCLWQRNVSSPEAPNTSHMCSWHFPSSIFLEWWRFLFTFFNVSDQIWRKYDQIEMKIHSEYDYKCIRNSLSTYSCNYWIVLSGKIKCFNKVAKLIIFMRFQLKAYTFILSPKLFYLCRPYYLKTSGWWCFVILMIGKQTLVPTICPHRNAW